jgi:inhibitor of KinA
MVAPEVELRFAAEEHVVAQIGSSVDLATVVRVLTCREHLLESAAGAVIVEAIPSWCSLLIHFDSSKVSPRSFFSTMVGFFRDLAIEGPLRLRSRLVTLPVLYGGEFGPDLEFVARTNQVSASEAIKRLSEGTHLVGMISFIPGQANCMWLEPEMVLTSPKYETPRTATPEGTVGLGGSSIALYSVPSPGGFQMVGRMPVPIYSPHPVLPEFEQSPILLRVGDRLRLRAIDRREYDDALQAVREGRYRFDISGESELIVAPETNGYDPRP